MSWPFKSIVSLNSVSLTLITIVMTSLLFLFEAPVFDMIEWGTYDLRFRYRGPQSPQPTVVLAVIDEKSLDTEGHWPWPRTKLADLVNILSRDGAKVIGFDVGFLEPDERSTLRFIKELKQELDTLAIHQPTLTDLINTYRKEADSDQQLADAIQQASADVVLGYFFHMNEAELGYRLQQDEIDDALKRISASKYPMVISGESAPNVTPFIRAYAPETSLSLLSDAADSSGYFSAQSDWDAIIRWMPLMIQAGDDLYPPLSLMSVWHYLDTPQLMVQVGRYGVEGVKMGERFIPTDENGRLLINYLGPARTFPHISVSDILSGAFEAGTFTDKIVIVGSTATGTYDLRSTPVGSVYPGAEIHATVINNILTQDFLTRPQWSRIYGLIAIAILALLVGLVSPRVGAVTGLGVAAVLFVLHIGIVYWVFVQFGLWLNLVYPLLALVVNYTAQTVYSYVREERERHQIKTTFSQYLPPLVMEEMLQHPEQLKLGGEEKVLTVLFSDLQGFSSHSERYNPHEITEFLGDYYTRMTEQVFAADGTLLNYIGDEILALFGAPINQVNHAEQACAAALAMRQHRGLLRAEWAATERPALIARTGINTGLMLVGNLGSKYRFSYGVLGDHVNLGSRLEGMNKQYGTEIIIAESTAELVQSSFRLRELDQVQVVGRSQPTGIYELIDAISTPLDPERELMMQRYAAGLEAYRQQAWYDAIELFKESLSQCPQDGPSHVMLSRSQLYQMTPPPKDWDGVFEATQK